MFMGKSVKTSHCEFPHEKEEVDGHYLLFPITINQANNCSMLIPKQAIYQNTAQAAFVYY